MSNNQTKMQKLLCRFIKPLPPGDLGRSYSREELIEDLGFLVNTVEAVHPNPFFACEEAAFRRETEQCKSRLISGLSRPAFYREVARLVAMINDGHTIVHAPSEEYIEYRNSNGVVFPFPVDCSSGEAVVNETVVDSPDVSPGDVITSVNGVSMSEILKQMKSLFGYEREAMKLAVISKQFSLFHFILNGGVEQFRFGISDNDGHRKSGCNGLISASLPQERPRSPKGQDLPYEYSIRIDLKAAVLDFRSFVAPEKFGTLMQQMFSEIEKHGIDRLIVDLRNNGGGDSRLSDIFFSFITDKPIRGYSRIELKVSRQIREYYRAVTRILFPFPAKHLPSRFAYPPPWKKPIGETVTETACRRKPRKRKKLYQGKLFVLTGPLTFSSATDFAAIVQDNSIGTVVGQPTGGYATCYGDSYPFVLPNSFLSCGVSHKLFVRPSGEEKPLPVIPDITITLPSLVGEKDSMRDYVLNKL